MYVLSFFTDGGVPKTSLTPTIKIIEVPSGTVVVNGLSMSELSNGFYYYNFSTYDYTKDYAILCDGGISLSDSERYVYAGNENFAEDINNVITGNELLKRVVGLMHENFYIDNPVYDTTNNLISARVRIYSAPGSVGSDLNVIGEYTITSEGDGAGKFTYWKQVKE